MKMEFKVIPSWKENVRQGEKARDQTKNRESSKFMAEPGWQDKDPAWPTSWQEPKHPEHQQGTQAGTQMGTDMRGGGLPTAPHHPSCASVCPISSTSRAASSQDLTTMLRTRSDQKHNTLTRPGPTDSMEQSADRKEKATARPL